MMRFIFTIALASAFFVAGAQDSTSFSKWSVSCQPTGFVDPSLTHFSAGIQYRVSKIIAVELQGGIIKSWFCAPNMNPEGNIDTALGREETNIAKNGFKIQAAIKVYPVRRLYFALRILYNDFEKTDRENVWRYGRAYTQKTELHKSITDVGANMNMGFIFDKPHSRFYFEVFSGLGLKYRTLKINKGLAEDAEIIVDEGADNGGTIFNDVTGHTVLPAFAFGITIGCKL